VSDTPLDTVHLHHCVQRWQQGDRAAADELLLACGDRLEHLARRMFKGFPNVRGWADTADVLQGSLLRLLNSLRNLRLAGTRDFFNLAAVHVRRELLDLARQVKSRGRAGGPAGVGSGDDPLARVADGGPSEEELGRWCRFHEAVEGLPAEEREVMGLAFYHGWTQAQIAELFGVSERTVRRHWQRACLRLAERVGGELPTA
jgi:RNA polymerase sigma-70 factor (ECF subfamily)